MLDPVSHFCIGCARTIEEIARWPGLSADQKRRIIAQLPSRFGPPQGRHTQSGLGSG
jgi:uncharacterized protein